MTADWSIFRPRFQRAMLQVGLGALALEAVIALILAYAAQAPSRAVTARTVIVKLTLDPSAFEAPGRRGVTVPLTLLDPPPRSAPVILPPEGADSAYRGHVDRSIDPPIARAPPLRAAKSGQWQILAEASPVFTQKHRSLDLLLPQSGMLLQLEDPQRRWSAQAFEFAERMRPALANALLAEGGVSSWQAVEMLDRAMSEPCDSAACTMAARPAAWAKNGEIAIGSFDVHAIFDYRQHLGGGDAQPRYLPHSLTANARSLTALFQDLDYALHEGTHIPGIFLRRLPHDIASLPQADDRKMLFVRAILPLIVHENEKNLTIRRRVLTLAPDIETRATLMAEDQEFIDEILGRFRMARFDLSELLARIDIVPPSLALAQAAEESGWGTSRMVREGNALFGEATWRIIGAAENAKIVREQRLFEDLATGVAAYMRNLNTHRAYETFRRRRAAIRAAGGIPDGPALTPYLQRYSERGDSYVQTIRNLIAINNLFAFDKVTFRNAPAAHNIDQATPPQ